MLIQNITSMIQKIQIDDIPAEVKEVGRFLLFDSIICATAAAPLERAQMISTLVRKSPHSSEASVFAKGLTSTASIAASANADLMNLLDADETFYNGAHFGAISTSAALAEGQRLQVDGEKLLLATIIGFEVSARLNMSSSLMHYVDGRFQFSQLSSHGYAAIGAVAAIGILRNFDEETFANALGLVTWLIPTAKNNYLSQRRRFNSLKYSPNWQIVNAAFLAADMAESGFEGDQDALNISPGIMEAQGFESQNLDKYFVDFGKDWHTKDTSFKFYPSCRFSHATLDVLNEYREREDLDLDLLDSITIYLGPGAYSISQFKDPIDLLNYDHITPFSIQFHMPFITAMTLLGVQPGPAWFDTKHLQDPKVISIMSKVKLELDEELNETWNQLVNSESRRTNVTRGSVIIQHGKSSEHLLQEYAYGDPWIPELRTTWEALNEKAHSFCDELVTQNAISELSQQLQSVEKVKDVTQLFDAVEYI